MDSKDPPVLREVFAIGGDAASVADDAVVAAAAGDDDDDRDKATLRSLRGEMRDDFGGEIRR